MLDYPLSADSTVLRRKEKHFKVKNLIKKALSMELRDDYDKNLNRIEGGCSRPRRADAHGEWGAFNEPHTKIYQRTERINAAIKKVFVFF